MICDKILECALSVHIEEEKEKKRKDTKQKKSIKKAELPKEKLESPCNNFNQQGKCIRYADVRPKAQCQEKGKTYMYDQSALETKQIVVCMHVDNGAMDGTEANNINKCDYSFFIKNDPVSTSLDKTILVELKGSDVKHALEQLKGTLNVEQFKKVGNSGCPIYGRVVCSRVPGIVYDDSVIKEKKAWQTKYRGSLKISSGNSMTDISESM